VTKFVKVTKVFRPIRS